MEMDLSGDDLKLAIDTQFFLAGAYISEEADYEDVTSHVTIYIDADTFLPSTVVIDMPEVGDQIVYDMMGIDDTEVTTCTIVTDYTGFDEFDKIEEPDMD